MVISDDEEDVTDTLQRKTTPLPMTRMPLNVKTSNADLREVKPRITSIGLDDKENHNLGSLNHSITDSEEPNDEDSELVLPSVLMEKRLKLPTGVRAPEIIERQENDSSDADFPAPKNPMPRSNRQRMRNPVSMKESPR